MRTILETKENGTVLVSFSYLKFCLHYEEDLQPSKIHSEKILSLTHKACFEVTNPEYL